ncbi:MAG: hypothetical protein ACRCT8_08875 [Lacipirellulaceae bacterium]
MPFEAIEAALAVAFALVWGYIGLVLLGDHLAEIRRKREGLDGPHFRSMNRDRRGKGRTTVVTRRGRRSKRAPSVGPDRVLG